MNVSFTAAGPQWALSFERDLEHSPDKVWRALTERELLREWFPADIEGEWEPGAALRFIFLHGEGDGLPEDQLLGEVLEVDPPRNLWFRWGDHFFRCELTTERGGCRLVFSDTFADASEGARNATGWNLCLANLDLILDGAAVAKFTIDRWHQRFTHYSKEFEAAAGPQQGLPENYPRTGEQ